LPRGSSLRALWRMARFNRACRPWRYPTSRMVLRLFRKIWRFGFCCTAQDRRRWRLVAQLYGTWLGIWVPTANASTIAACSDGACSRFLRLAGQIRVAIAAGGRDTAGNCCAAHRNLSSQTLSRFTLPASCSVNRSLRVFFHCWSAFHGSPHIPSHTLAASSTSFYRSALWVFGWRARCACRLCCFGVATGVMVNELRLSLGPVWLVSSAAVLILTVSPFGPPTLDLGVGHGSRSQWSGRR